MGLKGNSASGILFPLTDSGAESADTVQEDECAEDISAKFAFAYRWSFLEGIPAKLTVSRLNPEILDESEVNISQLSEIDDCEQSSDMKIPANKQMHSCPQAHKVINGS